MAKIIFILGGARSGKSAYALDLARRYKRKVAFIATCEALDKEMASRIRLHKHARPKNWQTFEEYYKISGLLKKIGNNFEVVLIDCLTLFVSNLMLEGLAQKAIKQEVSDLVYALGKIKAKVIIVSNEVGLGIVPTGKLGRDFRDLAGQINQIVAKESDEVFFMVSGIPWRIK